MQNNDLAIAFTPGQLEARGAADVIVDDPAEVPEATWRDLQALRL